MYCSAPTRRSLLLDLRASDNRAAWENFVRIYGPLIYGFCRSRGLQDADAADVMQEVLKAVARAIGKFNYNPSQGRFRSWLLTVTRNKLNNFFHVQQQHGRAEGGTAMLLRIEEIPSPETEHIWEAEYHTHLFRWAVEQVRADVQPKTWEAFKLAAIQGRPGEEVAAALGMTLGAVYVAKSRVAGRLRELIASVADHPPALVKELM